MEANSPPCLILVLPWAQLRGWSSPWNIPTTLPSLNSIPQENQNLRGCEYATLNKRIPSTKTGGKITFNCTEQQQHPAQRQKGAEKVGRREEIWIKAVFFPYVPHSLSTPCAVTWDAPCWQRTWPRLVNSLSTPWWVLFLFIFLVINY